MSYQEMQDGLAREARMATIVLAIRQFVAEIFWKQGRVEEAKKMEKLVEASQAEVSGWENLFHQSDHTLS